MRDSASGGRAERESLADSALSAQSLTQGSNSWTVRSSWPEPKSRVRCLTNWDTQALQPCFFLIVENFNINRTVQWTSIYASFIFNNHQDFATFALYVYLFFLFLCLNVLFFLNVYLERASMHKWGRGKERGVERESQAGSALSARSPRQGLNPQTHDHDLSWNQESGCLPDWATQVPLFKYVKANSILLGLYRFQYKFLKNKGILFT